jgi:hypothetical protein
MVLLLPYPFSSQHQIDSSSHLPSPPPGCPFFGEARIQRGPSTLTGTAMDCRPTRCRRHSGSSPVGRPLLCLLLIGGLVRLCTHGLLVGAALLFPPRASNALHCSGWGGAPTGPPSTAHHGLFVQRCEPIIPPLGASTCHAVRAGLSTYSSTPCIR